MLKLLQDMRTLSRCTYQALYRPTCLQINHYSAKPTADEIIQHKREVSKWIESMNEADQKRIRYIQNEVTVYALESGRSFDTDRIKLVDYQRLAAMSNNQRKKFYNYLSENMRRQDMTTRKRDASKEMKQGYGKPQRDKHAVDHNGHIKYGLGYNTLIRRVLASTIDTWRNRKVFHESHVTNQPQLIFDCGFGDIMTPRENLETARQLVECIGDNRKHRRPFSLQLSNLNMQGDLWHQMTKINPSIEDMEWHFQTTDYYNEIPKDKLIVITPDSPNMLKEFRPNMHYVLEATVNRSKRGPIMLAKAKELGLQTAALPVSLYLTMHRTRAFPLQHLTNVLLDVRAHGDWSEAFKHFAKRLFK